MYEHPEMTRLVAQQQYDWLKQEVDEARLAALVARGQPGAVRQLARSIGRTLVGLGNRLMQFGHAELESGLRNKNMSPSL